MRVKLRNLFVKPRASVVAQGPGEGGQAVRLRVDGMACDIWAGRVQRALEGLRGVRKAKVDLDTGEVLVRTEPDAEIGDAVAAVERLVILAWARGLLACAPFLGRRQP